MTIDNNLIPNVGKGGIESISIFDIEDIAYIQYDKVKNTFFNLELNVKRNIINIPLSRGTAEYKEIAENRKGMLWVEHRLTFSLDGIISKVSSDLKMLEKINQKGVAAIVKTKQGVNLLVGYSKKLKTESALRFKTSQINSAIMMYNSQIGRAHV